MKPPLSRLPGLSIPGMEPVQPTPPAPLVTVEVPRASGAIRVMLVDDHPTLLWGLVNLIESQRPRMEVVGTARTCAEALEKIGSLGADVILLDLDMGNMSAIDIIPSLLSQSRSNVLIFTGERDQAKLDLAVSRGARGVLRKDAPAEQVLKAIEKTAQGELWLDRETLGRMFNELRNPQSVHKHNPEVAKQSSLTVRERKIIHAVVESSGALNKTLAERLFISDHTLRNHLTSIYQKLGVSNRLELYVYAVKHQLAAPTDKPGSSN